MIKGRKHPDVRIRAKVHWNRKNGQGRAYIPKKAFEICPDEIEIKVPEEFLKEEFRKRRRKR